jgi:hypothetical protein
LKRRVIEVFLDVSYYLRRGHGTRQATSGAAAGGLRHGLGPAKSDQLSVLDGAQAENGFHQLVEKLCGPYIDASKV